MKKIGAILTLAALLVTLSASVCFADSGKLELSDSYPKDGSTGASIENLGVKLYFDGDMSEEKAGKTNKDIFQLYDSKGKELPTRVIYNSKEKGVVLVLLDMNSDEKVTVESNSEYTLKISGELVDDNGKQLGEDMEISFTTLNQKTNMLISMGMMVIMFGGMIVATSRAAKKTVEEERKKQDKVNPYKEAKKTGKSVEEIVEKDQKRKAKEAEKAAKRAAEMEEDEEEENDNYRVKARHSASEVGSRYVAAKRAAAEEERAKAAKRKAAAKKKKK